jgi:hypothetical protein
MNRRKEKPGRKFEEAVLAFVKTLDPAAEVLFDHNVTDRDTGQSRQCDVWINAKFGGHWAQSIIVSCKDHKRKLHAGDIGTFCDEKRSTGATMGVIYSCAGFTKPALEKARANQISCCRLYDNEPADLPDSIWIEQFACKPAVRVTMRPGSFTPQISKWGELFELRNSPSDRTLLDGIGQAFSACEAKGLETRNELSSAGIVTFPDNWTMDLGFDLNGSKGAVRVECIWKKYRARTQAVLLRGSYCLSNGSFKGTIVGPSIDTWGPNIGEGWELLKANESPRSPNLMLTILSGTDVREVLCKALSDQPLS